MSDRIAAGNIFMKEGTDFPGALLLKTEPYAAGWRLVKNLDGYGLGRQIQEAGWNFFCHAGHIKTIAFGIGEQQMMRRAVKRILAKMGTEKFNSLEITRVAKDRFFGVSYASVSAHPRHIHESVVLFETKVRPARQWARLAAA